MAVVASAVVVITVEWCSNRPASVAIYLATIAATDSGRTATKFVAILILKDMP